MGGSWEEAAADNGDGGGDCEGVDAGDQVAL